MRISVTVKPLLSSTAGSGSAIGGAVLPGGGSWKRKSRPLVAPGAHRGDIAAVRGDMATAKSALDTIKVVPNP